MNSPLLKWSDKYLIGIETIDDQHKHLIEVINRFNERLNTPKSNHDESFRAAVKDAVEYVKYHFSAEQDLMQNINYPRLNEQKQMHNKFIAELLEEVNKYEHGDKNAPNRLMRFLKEWVQNHISIEDAKIGIFLGKHKELHPLNASTSTGAEDSK